jgi:hypothetical protein
MWALQLTARVRVNIYADSKYAFITTHVHGDLYKERGLVNSGGKSIKHGQEIFELLDAVWAPKWVAVMHQKGDATIAQGNRKADRGQTSGLHKGTNPKCPDGFVPLPLI